MRNKSEDLRIIERAFHEQTTYLNENFDRMASRMENLQKGMMEAINAQSKWIIGLMITGYIAIIAAVLFQ